ncbi:MAG: aminoglycoside phosphotransferase family protein [Pseudomonadota bacterium]
MSDMNPPSEAADTDPRLAILRSWLDERFPGDEIILEPVAADASRRRYFRVRLGERHWIAMDAPPEHEDAGGFWRLADGLRELGLHAPEVLDGDAGRGLLLLEDLGDTPFSRALDERPARAEALYHSAVETLVVLQRNWTEERLPLEAYDRDQLLAEAALLVDWYYPEVAGKPCPPDVRQAYFEAWDAVLPEASKLPATMVLRDYHVDNLMVLPEDRSGCGLLDFQDARAGSPAYDLVSLLRDARRDVPEGLEQTLFEAFADQRPELDRAELACAYWILGAQRNAKILGIFTRLARRDDKRTYLPHIERVWRLLAVELAQPALGPVAAWFERAIPPEWRHVPVLDEEGE